MALSQKIAKINATSALPKMTAGKCKSLDEFWASFIEPLLPQRSAVEKWHRILKEYVNKPDAIFFMRAYGSPSGNSPILRRGFLNRTNRGFSAFYGDNFFTAYFYSMAYDGFAPGNVSELELMMRNRTFPCGCIQTASEKQYAAYTRGKNPGITTKGYKIAHIYSSGKDFHQDAGYPTIGTFCDQVFPRGVRAEWDHLDTDSYGTYHYRPVSIASSDSEKVRKFLVAHFIRTVHPLNYFLVPKEKSICWKDAAGDAHYEIGENEDLIRYVACKIRERYPIIYDEFLGMIFPHAFHTGSPVSQAMDIEYQLNKWKSAPKSGRPPKSVSAPAKSGSGVGQYIKGELTRLLEGKLISPSMIDNLKDRSYCSKNLGISFPVIVETAEPLNRYYKGEPVCGKYRICSQWVVRHRAKFDRWLTEINGTIKYI